MKEIAENVVVMLWRVDAKTGGVQRRNDGGRITFTTWITSFLHGKKRCSCAEVSFSLGRR